MKEKMSVCLPVRNGAATILATIKSILSQSFKDFELLIVDNASTDNTVKIVKSVKDRRIRLCQNKKNIGSGGNFDTCKKKAAGSILFYICDDDIVDKYALEKVYQAFSVSDDIGIVTRPYFWFDADVTRPIRLTRQFKKDKIVSMKSSYKEIRDVIATADQISGIAFRKRYMKDFSFSNTNFIEMASMVLPVFKISKAYILKDNIIGVRVAYSGARVPKIYKKSPMMAWYGLIHQVYHEKKFENLKRYLVQEFIANNYVGLVQVKNYGGMKYLIREICHLLRLRWKNIFSFKFWFYSLMTLLTPAFLLKKIVDFYKNEVNSRLIKRKKIDFAFKL